MSNSRPFVSGIIATAALLAGILIPGCKVMAQNNVGTTVPVRSLVTISIPSPLTEDDAVRIGLEQNPQVIAAQAGVTSTKDNYRSLSAFPSPQFGVSRIQGSSTAPSLTGNTYDTIASVNETLDTSGQRRMQAAGTKAQWRVAQHQFSETELSLAQQIRDAYWSLVGSRAQADIAGENLKDAQQVYNLTQLQEKAGSSPRSDVLNSSIDLANAKQAYISAQGVEQSALSALNLLLARPPYAPLTPADTLSTSGQSTAVAIPNLLQLTRLAQANRPILKAARDQVRSAEYAVKQARASRWPDVTIGYQRSLEEPLDSATVGVQFPLLDFGDIKNSIRSADQAQKQAEAQETQTNQQVSQQVAQAYSDYVQSQTLLASYQTDILDPSVKLMSMAQLGYKQGATGILNVINAETTLRAARNGYINSLLAVHKAEDELLAATGGIPGMITMPTEIHKTKGKH